MKNHKFVVIGITGQTSSGKNTVVENLIDKYDFEHRSARNYINSWLKREGKELTRKNMGTKANELRERYGSQHVLECISEDINPNKNYLLESVRNSGEIEYLRNKFPNFVLLAVTAPPKERIKRFKKDSEYGNGNVAENFMGQEKRENDLQNPAGQQITSCIEMADYTIVNDGSLENLLEKTEEFMSKIR